MSLISETNAREHRPTNDVTKLAYIGDAVYEVYIREHVLEKSAAKIHLLNKAATRYVRAEGQAAALKRLMAEELTEEETALVKRARNHRISSKPQKADPVVYKLATAFEALVGHLYLQGQKERLEQIVALAIEIIDSSEIDEKR